MEAGQAVFADGFYGIQLNRKGMVTQKYKMEWELRSTNVQKHAR